MVTLLPLAEPPDWKATPRPVVVAVPVICSAPPALRLALRTSTRVLFSAAPLAVMLALSAAVMVLPTTETGAGALAVKRPVLMLRLVRPIAPPVLVMVSGAVLRPVNGFNTVQMLVTAEFASTAA